MVLSGETMKHMQAPHPPTYRLVHLLMLVVIIIVAVAEVAGEIGVEKVGQEKSYSQ